jgi:hypothetical protein
MALFSGKKWPRFILAAYLAFATMGIFTFLAVEPLRAVDFLEDEPLAGGFFTPIDYTIDCLAEGETIMGRAGGYSFSPVRNGAPRVPMFAGTQTIDSVLTQSSLGAIEKINDLNIKSTILLKLRI